MKLNQCIAVEKGQKASVEEAINKIRQAITKPDVFSGVTKTYSPKEEGGETFPGEIKRVITTMPEVLDEISNEMTRLFDITATKVYANTGAKADVVIDGTTILSNVPVEYLLFLENRLGELNTLFSKCPVLDPLIKWIVDSNTGLFKTETPTVTYRTKKVLRNHEKAPATAQFPAQVEVYTEDATVGEWTTVLSSGALSATRLKQLKTRLESLRSAVLQAREEANMAEAPVVAVGKIVFDYLFA